MLKLLQWEKVCLKYKFTKNVPSKFAGRQKLNRDLLSIQIVRLPNCLAFIGFKKQSAGKSIENKNFEFIGTSQRAKILFNQPNG